MSDGRTKRSDYDEETYIRSILTLIDHGLRAAAEHDLRYMLMMARQSAPSSRDAVLEEAAKVCDLNADACESGYRKSCGVVGYAFQAEGSRECADAIRALKEHDTPQVDSRQPANSDRKPGAVPARASSWAGAEDARDAARYRWLRTERDEQQPVVTIAKFFNWGVPWRDIPLWGDELDAQVDNAMADELAATSEGTK